MWMKNYGAFFLSAPLSAIHRSSHLFLHCVKHFQHSSILCAGNRPLSFHRAKGLWTCLEKNAWLVPKKVRRRQTKWYISHCSQSPRTNCIQTRKQHLCCVPVSDSLFIYFCLHMEIFSNTFPPCWVGALWRREDLFQIYISLKHR